MRIKNTYLLGSDDLIESVKAINGLKVPVVTGYDLMMCTNVIAEHHASLEKLRSKILNQYGKLVKSEGERQTFTIPPEFKEAYSKDMTDLGNLEFDLPIEEKIKINVQKLTEEITVKDMGIVSFYVDWVKA